MADLSEWTPRHIEDPHWFVVSRSCKALAPVISLRVKKMECSSPLIDKAHELRTPVSQSGYPTVLI